MILTSNRTRELHDALKRRCLYHWIDYPGREREAEIVHTRLPGVPDEIADRVCAAVARLRGEDLYKLPGVGETIAWARALVALGDDAGLDETLGAALKVREDIERVRERGCSRVSEARSSASVAGPGAARCGPGGARSGWARCSSPIARSRRSTRPTRGRRTWRCGPRSAPEHADLAAFAAAFARASATSCHQQPPIDPVATAVLPRVAVPDPAPGSLDLADPGELAAGGRERGRAPAR